jgi:hypothetical protein
MLAYLTLHPGDDTETDDATKLIGYLAGTRILDWYVPLQDKKGKDWRQRADEESDELGSKIGGFRAVFNGSKDARAYYRDKRAPLVKGLDSSGPLDKDTIARIEAGIANGFFTPPQAFAQRLYFTAGGNHPADSMTSLMDDYIKIGLRLDPQVLCDKIKRMKWVEY